MHSIEEEASQKHIIETLIPCEHLHTQNTKAEHAL